MYFGNHFIALRILNQNSYTKNTIVDIMGRELISFKNWGSKSREYDLAHCHVSFDGNTEKVSIKKLKVPKRKVVVKKILDTKHKYKI